MDGQLFRGGLSDLVRIPRRDSRTACLCSSNKRTVVVTDFVEVWQGLIMINRPKDVADLFLRFGGDPGAYQEFKPAIQASRGADPWVLVSAFRAGLATTASSQPEVVFLPEGQVSAVNARPFDPSRAKPISSAQPCPVRSGPTVLPPSVAFSETEASVALIPGALSGTPPSAVIPRQLDLLFERLAGVVTAPAITTGHSTLARWCLPS